MDTFDIKDSNDEKSKVHPLDTPIGSQIKNTALLLKVNQEFSVSLELLKEFKFPYTILDINILDNVRKETGWGYSINKQKAENNHIGYTIKRFR